MKTSRYNYYQPSLGNSWLLVALFVGGSLLMGFILGALKLLIPSSIFDWQSLSYIMSFVIPFIYIFIASGNERSMAQFTGLQPVAINKPDFGDFKALPFFLLLMLTVLALGVVIEPLTYFIPMPEAVKQLFESIFNNSSTADLVLSTCILAPLCEEFFCRGLMTRGMAQHGSAKKAIIWSAVIFAVIHMNPWQSIPAFVIGLLFGWVYYRTGSLWATIFMHCVNNTISVILSKTMPDMAVDSSFIDILPTGWYIALYATCLAITVAAIMLLNKKMPKKALK